MESWRGSVSADKASLTASHSRSSDRGVYVCVQNFTHMINRIRPTLLGHMMSKKLFWKLLDTIFLGFSK